MTIKEKNNLTGSIVRRPFDGNGSGNGYDGCGGIPHRYSNYSIPIHPARLGLWLLIAASVMLFAAFTSAYLVRQNSTDWIRIPLPSILWFTSVIIVLSSISAHWAYVSIKRGVPHRLKTGLLVSVMLGIAFIIGQTTAWSHLSAVGLYLHSNPASSFFYILTGVHVVHIVIAMLFLSIVTIRALRNKYSPDNNLGVELVVTFWHFLGAVWLYLYIFLLVLQPV
jgi:cytochrome c oxidase subunit III